MTIPSSEKSFALPFLTWVRCISAQSLKTDLFAGFTSAVIVLPQSVAFAMIAGLPLEYGFYTAMITPVVAALFGSSHHMISGPTTAISILVFTSISPYAEPGSADFIRLTLSLTLMAGLFQTAFGLGRLGVLVNFISHSALIGFVSGAAILIATSQLKHVFGIAMGDGSSFFQTWAEFIRQLPHTNAYVLIVAASTMICALLVHRFLPRWPHMLIGMILGGIVSFLLGGQERGIHLVGELHVRLPPLSLPDFSLGTMRQLAPQAMAVALLGLIEAVSIARSISMLSYQRIHVNQEFIGQGLSNIVGSFFSSYAGSGSFTRSAINFQAGAQTPLAAVFSAAFLALIVLLIAPLSAYLPSAAMGGIILLVAFHLIDLKHIRSIMKSSRAEATVLLATFFSALFLELEFSILAGVLLSLGFYLNRTGRPSIASLSPDPQCSNRRLIEVEGRSLPECRQLKLIRIDGSLFFGAVHHIEQQLQAIDMQSPMLKHVLIIANGINFIDLSGAEMLAHEARRRKKIGGGLYFCGLKKEPLRMLQKSGYLEAIGNTHLFVSKAQAIEEILKRLDPDECRRCASRIFIECSRPQILERQRIMPKP